MIRSSHFIDISTTICSFDGAPHNFNILLLLHRRSFPIGHWFPIVMSYFWNFRHCACRALPGTHPIHSRMTVFTGRVMMNQLKAGLHFVVSFVFLFFLTGMMVPIHIRCIWGPTPAGWWRFQFWNRDFVGERLISLIPITNSHCI